MPAIIQRAQEIPAHETGRLRELFDAALCAMEYGLGRDKSQLSVTSFAAVHLRGVDVIRDQGIGQRAGIRTPSHIEAHHADDFLICLPREAQVTLAQSGIRSQFGAGSFALLSTARPFSALITATQPRAAFSHTIIRIPGPRLRSRVPHIDGCCGRPLLIRPGAGRIMATLFDLALAEGSALSDSEAAHFSESLLDHIADATLGAPELVMELRAGVSAQARLHEKACQFIRSRLSDPDLNAEQVARHCGVSTRCLRAAFATAASGFGTFVRETRLQECRKALREPRLAGRSIMDVAMLWGFNDAAWFSRAYRRQFGIPPSAERRAAHASPASR